MKTFLRTPAQWSQLLIVGALVAVFVINMKMIPMPHPSVKNFVSYLNLIMAMFIVAGLNSRFTFTSIPGEGPGQVHIFSSPYAKVKFYRFKLLFHLLPLLLIGFALYALGDLALHFDAFTRVIALVFLAPAIIFLTVLSLVLGIETNETNPLVARARDRLQAGHLLHALEHDLPGRRHARPGASGGRFLLAPLHPRGGPLRGDRRLVPRLPAGQFRPDRVSTTAGAGRVAGQRAVNCSDRDAVNEPS